MGKDECFHFPEEGPIWEYICFCEEKDDSLEHQLLEVLKTILELPDNYFDVYLDGDFYRQIPKLLKDKDTLSKIKDAYSKVFTNGHNSYSMPVLSHRLKHTKPDNEPFDCLYTGDVENTKWIIDLTSNYNPAFIQVPHHGSNYNHDIKIYRNHPTAFVSVGISNNYRHPGLITLPDLIDECKEVKIITEARESFVKTIKL